MKSKHWNEIYDQKSDQEVSWFQDIPTSSLALIDELKLKFEDGIIDIGAGNSRLVDSLLSRGFHNISILDISAVAIENSRTRLGENSKSIKFITSDVTKFAPKEDYKLWHDRATFHFLTTSEEIESYLEVANRAISDEGFLIVSTFSKTGPDKCSGLPISKYSEFDLKTLFEKYFSNIRCFEDKHSTPWGTNQDFVYCGFKKR